MGANRGVTGGLELFVASITCHNLQIFAAEIERDYFSNRFPQRRRPVIRWGKSIGRRKRHSIRLGSYHRTSGVIRIHPRLNSSDVPHFFVKSILYHEYLHHLFGPNHNRRFQRQEQKFRYYKEAKAWLRRHLPMLLGHRVTPLPRTGRRAKHATVQLPLFM